MARSSSAPLKSVADYNPDSDIGSTLDDINGQQVTIAAVEFEERSGRNGPYALSIITLDDGRVFHTGSPVIAKRLSAVGSMFPVLATFNLVKSTQDPRKSYWTVA